MASSTPPMGLRSIPNQVMQGDSWSFVIDTAPLQPLLDAPARALVQRVQAQADAMKGGLPNIQTGAQQLFDDLTALQLALAGVEPALRRVGDIVSFVEQVLQPLHDAASMPTGSAQRCAVVGQELRHEAFVRWRQAQAELSARLDALTTRRLLLQAVPAPAGTLELDEVGGAFQYRRHEDDVAPFKLTFHARIGGAPVRHTVTVTPQPDRACVLAALVRQLSDPQPARRVAAAAALGRIGPAAGTASAALGTALADSDAGVRAAVATALGQLGAAAAGTVVALSARLADADGAVQVAAAQALGRLGSGSATAALVNALEQAALRPAALQALAALGPQAASAVPALVKLHAAADAPLRLALRQALQAAGVPSPAALPELVRLLSHAAAPVRCAAAGVVGGCGAAAASAAPRLAELMSGDAAVRAAALDALVLLGPGAAAAVPALTELLQADAAEVRRAAATALQALGEPVAAVSTPRLLSLLTAPRSEVRQEALRVLRALPGAAFAAMPLHLQRLGHADPAVRAEAARLIGSFGLQAKATIPSLLRLLADEHELPRTAATAALEQMLRYLTQFDGPSGEVIELLGHPAAAVQRAAASLLDILQVSPADVHALFSHLDAPADFVRSAAARAIGRARWAPPDALARLLEWLAGPDTAMRQTALDTLTALGPAAATAVPRLIASLGAADEALHAAITRALAASGAPPASALTDLAALLVEPRPNVRVAALQSLGSLGEQAAGWGGEVAKCLADPQEPVRDAAVDVLLRLGMPHAAALDALVAQLDSPHEAVRLAVLGALAKAAPALGAQGARLAALLAEPRAAPAQLAAVLNVLAAMGPAAHPALNSAAALLQHPQPAVQLGAAQLLAQLGAVPAAALPHLAELLACGDTARVIAAATALRNAGQAATAITHLTPLLAHADPAVRGAAAACIGSAGAAGLPAAPALKTLLYAHFGYSEDPRFAASALAQVGDALTLLEGLHAGYPVNAAVIEVLPVLGPAAAPAVPWLVTEMQGVFVWAPEAMRALGLLGAHATTAVPALQHQLKALPHVPPVAAEALLRIAAATDGSLALATQLLDFVYSPPLENEDLGNFPQAPPRSEVRHRNDELRATVGSVTQAVRSLAVQALAEMGPDAAPAASKLLQLYLAAPEQILRPPFPAELQALPPASRDPVAALAADALQRIGRAAVPLVLAAEASAGLATLAPLLLRLGPLAAPVVPKAVALLAHGPTSINWELGATLLAALAPGDTPAAAQVVAQVIPLLSSRSWPERQQAVRLLACVGHGQAVAAEALMKLAQSDALDRSEVCQALARLGAVQALPLLEQLMHEAADAGQRSAAWAAWRSLRKADSDGA